MQKRIAMLYDFDYTLANGFMQQFGLMQEFGYDNVIKYFQANDDVFDNRDIDMCLAMMGGVLACAKNSGIPVTKEFLRKHGQNVVYYPGVVDEWFEKINALGAKYGFEIEHYIISSGLKEIVEGSVIHKYLKRVYANSFCYNEKGEAFWPCQVVNYTSKTQYIYRVRKNALDDLRSLSQVNAKLKDEEQLSFKKILYFGDSQTDIPSFKVVKNNGGMSICVFDESNPESRQVALKCYEEGRVNFFVPADYREGSELYNLVSSYIENVMKEQISRENE
jgi:hypothetical protein